METINPKEKAIQLLAGAIAEVRSDVSKKQVKLNLLSTIDANLKYWEEVKKALEEIS